MAKKSNSKMRRIFFSTVLLSLVCVAVVSYLFKDKIHAQFLLHDIRQDQSLVNEWILEEDISIPQSIALAKFFETSEGRTYLLDELLGEMLESQKHLGTMMDSQPISIFFYQPNERYKTALRTRWGKSAEKRCCYNSLPAEKLSVSIEPYLQHLLAYPITSKKQPDRTYVFMNPENLPQVDEFFPPEPIITKRGMRITAFGFRSSEKTKKLHLDETQKVSPEKLAQILTDVRAKGIQDGSYYIRPKPNV